MQTHMHANVPRQIHTHTHACANTRTLLCSSSRRTRSWRRPVREETALLEACLPLARGSLPTSPNGSPKSLRTGPDRKGIFSALPNYRARPGPGPASPAVPSPLPVSFPVCRGVAGRAVSRTRCPRGLNYLAGPWPLKWLQRPPGGSVSLTCRHLFSWAPGLWPGIFNGRGFNNAA